jgi:cytochrome c biogenesis protein CcmG/thiol:disulfide interchange protein DsbE
MLRFPVRRNALVLSAVVLILAIFACAGWLNWKLRRQAAERTLAGLMQSEAAPEAAAPQFASALIGKPAPAFTLEDLHGNKISLANYRGRPLVINFWATWCGPCKIETPWLIELRQKYAPQGLEVLAVNAEGDEPAANEMAAHTRYKTAVAKFAERMRIPYPVLIDGDSISRSYGGLDDLPASFFVNRKGTIVAAQVGLLSEDAGAGKDEIESNIRKALSK